MNKLILGCALLASLLLSSCLFNGRRVKGNGKIMTETRDVQRADRIKLTASMNVVLSKGLTAVKVEGDENLLQYIIVQEEDGWLTISVKKGIRFYNSNRLSVYVTTPAIKQVSITGSGDVTSDEKFESDQEVAFSVSGSGNIDVPVHAPVVSARVTGSGNIKASGETRNLNLQLTGSGNFEGQALKSENAEVKVTGSGDADVYADNKLKATILGSGSVQYAGNPAIEKKIVGSGRVSKNGE